MPQSLEKLLNPGSIAVIGGGFWGNNVIGHCRAFDFPGRVMVVHPHKDEIAGIPAVKTVSDLPEVPDAAFVGVNRTATIPVVAELAALGCGGAACFASGFAEAAAEYPDGPDLQKALIEAAGDMPFLGPNCYGVINALDRSVIWPDTHGLEPVDTGVAILAQSSNIAINLSMRRLALPIGMMVTLGNQAQVNLPEVALAIVEDPGITAIGCYIEGVNDVEAWHRLAVRAHALGKPIIALKVGTSSHAQAATLSHTGSLVGSEIGADTLLRRLGIARVNDLPTFLETLKIAHHGGWLPEASLATLSCSGGEASLIADIGTLSGITLPPLTDQIDRRLHAVLGDGVARANPLDYHTYIWGDYQALFDVFATMIAGSWAFTALIIDFPKIEVETYTLALRAFTDAHKAEGGRVGVLASLPENIPEPLAQKLSAAGIIPLFGFREATDAIVTLARPNPDLSPLLPPPALSATTRTLDEDRAKKMLRAAGLPVPDGKTATDHAELYNMSASLPFPQVLKGLGLAHKTEHGAVKIGLTSPDLVCQAAADMPASHFLIEEMIGDVVCELLVGIVLDPAHGYVLTIGAGGEKVELLKDTASLLLPARRDDIERALKRLKIAPILHGYRNKPGVDWSKLLDFLVALAQFATDPANRLIECEINPLLCSPDRVAAADALLVVADPTEQPT